MSSDRPMSGTAELAAMVTKVRVSSGPCVHCGKARSRHHVARSDGYTFLRCFTLSELRWHHKATYYTERDPAASRPLPTGERRG